METGPVRLDHPIGNQSQNNRTHSSRCAIFRFSRVEKSAMKQHLIDIQPKKYVLLLSGRSHCRILRRRPAPAINALQTASAYKEGVIDEKTVAVVIGEQAPWQVQKMIPKRYRAFYGARKVMYDIMGFRLQRTEIIRQIQREIFKRSDLTAEQKADLQVSSAYDCPLNRGRHPSIQLSAL
jgi:DNA polymerase III delta prime subunit